MEQPSILSVASIDENRVYDAPYVPPAHLMQQQQHQLQYHQPQQRAHDSPGIMKSIDQMSQSSSYRGRMLQLQQ